MKFGVVGCGALGSYYGAKLIRSGCEVHLLLRSDFDVVRQKGLRVRSPDGDFHVHPVCSDRPEPIGICEVVLIGLKTTANDQFWGLLKPLVGEHTTLLTLQNGLGNEEQLAGLFGEERVMGGLCFVCLNRVEPGLVQHLGYGQVVLGEYRRRPQSRTHEIAGLFREAGVACRITENLAQAHWEKLVWNIPFNGLGVASAAGIEAVRHGELIRGAALGPCWSTEALLASAAWESLVRELMLEVIATARQLGYAIPESLADKQIARTRSMGAYKASTAIDLERGQPLELESLFLRPLREAAATGVATPRLSALCRVLQALNPPAPRPLG